MRTLPVKLTPARCGELVTVSPNVGPSAGVKLMTPEVGRGGAGGGAGRI